MPKLPDFDTLRALHEKDPEALERLRQQLTANIVAQAPDENRRRLAGLQFRINMELLRAGNPTARLLRLSSMMYDSVIELDHCLHNPVETIRARHARPLADILPLRRN